jgi:predicted nuclease of predicted toxin-antitoxin system
MRFLVDMNLTPRWTSYLSAAGHDAVHWSTVGPIDAEDGFAAHSGLVVITNDLDFPRILACTRAAGPSVILLRGYPLTPEARGPSLLRMIASWAEALTSGAILSVDLSGHPRAPTAVEMSGSTGSCGKRMAVR